MRACAAHWGRTGHRAQMALALVSRSRRKLGAVWSGAKNTEPSRLRQLPLSCHSQASAIGGGSRLRLDMLSPSDQVRVRLG
jgi:hypothetical protein